MCRFVAGERYFLFLIRTVDFKNELKKKLQGIELYEKPIYTSWIDDKTRRMISPILTKRTSVTFFYLTNLVGTGRSSTGNRADCKGKLLYEYQYGKQWK